MALHRLQGVAHHLSEELAEVVIGKDEVIDSVLTKLSQRLLDKLIAALEKLHVPDESGQIGVYCFTLKYDTRNGAFHGVGHPHSVCDFDLPSRTFTWTGTDVGISGSGNWGYSYLCCSTDSGNFSVCVTEISFLLKVAIVKDDDGHLALRFDEESYLKLGKVYFEADGGGTIGWCAARAFRALARPWVLRKVLDTVKRVAEEKARDALHSVVDGPMFDHFPFNQIHFIDKI